MLRFSLPWSERGGKAEGLRRGPSRRLAPRAQGAFSRPRLRGLLCATLRPRRQSCRRPPARPALVRLPPGKSRESHRRLTRHPEAAESSERANEPAAPRRAQGRLRLGEEAGRLRCRARAARSRLPAGSLEPRRAKQPLPRRRWKVEEPRGSEGAPWWGEALPKKRSPRLQPLSSPCVG